MTARPRLVLVLLALLALLASACGGDARAGELRADVPRATPGVDDAKVAATGVDQLGLDLLHLGLGSANGNVALSPWSIATALTMARAGAKGPTAAEMDAVLHVADPSTIDQAMNGLDQAVASRNGSFPGTGSDSDKTLKIDVSAANRAFVQDGAHIEAPFLDTLARSYGVGVGLVDYEKNAEQARAEINRWVAGQTRDKITELIAKGLLSDATRLVLVNAVYLNADWAEPFKKDETRDETFHAPKADVSVPMMHSNGPRGFASGDGWKAVDLDYVGGQLAMTVLLPDEGRFDEVTSQLDTTMLAAVTSTTATTVQLSLPKFHVNSALSLRQQLSTLGMPTAFSDEADFSGITTEVPLEIGDVVHQADVTIDEKGTVAAAATADVFNTVGAAIPVQQVTVDRPFVFLLRDKATGAILFAGQVIDPSA